MNDLRIIKFTKEWEDSLRRYMHKTFPSYSEEYINFCINNSTGDSPALLVVKDDEIIGCQLFYCTQAIINDKLCNVQWGHDTFLDKQYRSQIGLDFVWSINSIKRIFGIGLTEVNRKIYKLLKAIFFDGVYTFYLVNPYILYNLFQKVFHVKQQTKWPELLKGRNCVFKRASSPSDINIINGGYWYKGVNDIDFIRDTNFLDKRFFRSKVFNYAVYSSVESYFVVRKTLFRGFPALLLCDFRYNPSCKHSISDLINAVMKLAKSSKLGIVFFLSGDKNINRYFNNRVHYKRPVDFVSTMKVSEQATFAITGADADAELLC